MLVFIVKTVHELAIQLPKHIYGKSVNKSVDIQEEGVKDSHIGIEVARSTIVIIPNTSKICPAPAVNSQALINFENIKKRRFFVII